MIFPSWHNSLSPLPFLNVTKYFIADFHKITTDSLNDSDIFLRRITKQLNELYNKNLISNQNT